MRDSSVEVGDSSSLAKRLAQLLGLCAVAVLLSGCSLWGWGGNRYGDLGFGETRVDFQPEPVRVSDDLGKVSLADKHACGIDSNQFLYCWGLNQFREYGPSSLDGSLGVGDLQNRQVPTRVGDDRWLEVDTRPEGGTCGIRVDGTLWCWGDGVLKPAPVGSALWRTVELLGLEAACGIQADSSLWCWGEPFAVGGEKIGDGWQTLVGTRQSPLAEGFCGLRTDGLRWCVDGAQDPPYQADAFQWAEVAGPTRPDFRPPSPDSQDCGIQTDLSLWCDVDGELARYPFGLWQSVDGTDQRSCGVQVDGTLWCFDDFPAAPVQIGNDTDWVEAFAGWDNVFLVPVDQYQCATKTDGSLWCWGTDTSDQLGDPGPVDRPDPTPIGNIDWAQIAAGSAVTCGIDTSDGLWCWGTGQPIGLGSDSDGPVTATEPTKIGDARWVDVDTSVTGKGSPLAGLGGHACGVQVDTSLWCWGVPFNWELGVPFPNENPAVPNRVGGSDWAQVTTGLDHTCAIKTDGALWCWGSHRNGQLGIGGGVPEQWIPVPVGEASWKQVSAGTGFTCGVQTDDSLWCWGANTFGTLLGDPTLETNGLPLSLVPARIGNASWDSVSLGASHTCGLQTDGSLWCWGFNFSSEIGIDQNAAHVQVPTRVGSATWSMVDGGGNHTCGIQEGGTLWCWGRGFNGQLGLGGFDLARSPQQVGTSTDWFTVSAGGIRTMALR